MSSPPVPQQRKTNEILVSEYITSLSLDHQEITDWFVWPPDTFLLVSTLFRLTGCYRVALWPKGPTFEHEGNTCQPLWLNRKWQSSMENVAKNWMRESATALADPAYSMSFDYELNLGDTGNDETEYKTLDGEQILSFQDLIADFIRLAQTTTLNNLKVLQESFEPQNVGLFKSAFFLARHLIVINAIADHAGQRLGVPYAPYETEDEVKAPKEITRPDDGLGPSAALAEFYGNLLLTTYGSLSTLPKHIGIVLPKMRTPQSGITPRSVSHYLTYHVSEVEVMWRTMPWPNQTENTLNILCFPLPLTTNPQAFEPKPERFEAVRYFDYVIPKEGRGKLTAGILEQLKKCEAEVGRVHILAFPEMALTETEFEELLVRLQREHARRDRIPFVIAGVRNERKVNLQNAHKAQQVSEPSSNEATKGDANTDGNDANNINADSTIVTNEVRLAAYFAGSWYKTIQKKHHRWKLDGYQIRQYQLEGRLPTRRDWFEDIPVAQRRLTFVSPNGWLTLCPLICEDLAQLEPVASIIRGVGPTLLFALLSDGPQLKYRWSARYASVLADDPGTAVLTLTSLGMARQSLAHSGVQEDSSKAEIPKPVLHWTVGLWRDQVRGWYPVNLTKEHGAFLLTVAADWKEEITLDGRSDHTQSARFRAEGVRHYEWQIPHSEEKSGDTALKEITASGNSTRIATWTDFREFSALIYAIDTLISLHGDEKKSQLVCEWLLIGARSADETAEMFSADTSGREMFYNRSRKMLDLLALAQANPFSIGVDTEADLPWPTTSLTRAFEILVEFKASFNVEPIAPGKCVVPTWEKVFKRIESRLARSWSTWKDVDNLFEPSSFGSPSPQIIFQPTVEGVRYQLCMITLQNLHFRLDAAISPQDSNGSDSSPYGVKDLRHASALLTCVQNALEKYAV